MLIARLLQKRLLAALDAHPVVFLNGPRQAGKSTLAQNLGESGYEADYVTFDNATQMAAAAHAPEAYLSARTRSLIIDEVQLVPEIFRALKTVVDSGRRKDGAVNGRFLLTGSANILALPKLSDPLVGRMGTLTLFPLAGAEILGGQGDFIERLFAGQFSKQKDNPSLVDMIARSTYPEISKASLQTRSLWFEGYLTTILQRDVRNLAEIEKLSALPNLLRILAGRAGGLINDAEIARDAGLVHVTSRNYKTLLKMLFLSFEIEPWHRNVTKRLVKAPKGYLVDTPLLCHLLNYDLETISRDRPEIFGHVLENYVATELIKLSAPLERRPKLLHFRTSDNKEVDFVLEQTDGRLAAIEVKGRETLDRADFKGLEVLRELAGQDFKVGIVLYRGQDIIPFGDNLWAVPIGSLWS